MTETDGRLRDARRATLVRAVGHVPARLTYLYDFGDEWLHRIAIESEEPAEARKRYPICVAGDGPCPPEDCGGPSGFAELRRALADPGHPDHFEQRAWAAEMGYPTPFSAQTATRKLRAAQSRTARA